MELLFKMLLDLIVLISTLTIAGTAILLPWYFLCKWLQKKGYGPQLEAIADKIVRFKLLFAPAAARTAYNATKGLNSIPYLGNKHSRRMSDEALDALLKEIEAEKRARAEIKEKNHD